MKEPTQEPQQEEVRAESEEAQRFLDLAKQVVKAPKRARVPTKDHGKGTDKAPGRVKE